MDGEETKEPEPKPRKTKAKETEPLTADDVAELLKAHAGDSNAALRAVMLDRDKHRDEANELRGKLPKDGHVVLDPERAKTLAAYEALGDPAGLAKALEDGKTATGDLAVMRRKQHHAEIGKLMNWDADVLDERATATGAEFIVKDEPDPKDPKKKVKVPHVKLEGDKTAPLAEHGTNTPEWSKYLPALKLEPAKPEVTPRGSPPSNGLAPARPPVIATPDQPRRSLVR